jgi:pimeloyl-ACP methyl ester carboxylesterase
VIHPSGLHVVRHHVDAPGPPVVLVHGAPDRSKNFAHVVHRLTDLNVTVYDRRGYGRSLDAAVRADGTFAGGFDVHADDLVTILDGTPSIVVGQSAGGSVAMLAATKAPDLFLALGAWEPPMVPWDWWLGAGAAERTAQWAAYDDALQVGEDFNRSILGDARWDGLRDSTKDLLRAEGRAFRADMRYQDEPFLEVDQIKVPFLVGAGTEATDEFVSAHGRLAERAGADLFVGRGADHFAHLGKPEVWAAFVRATVALAARAAAPG